MGSNCGAQTAQCADSGSNNGAGGTAGDSGASGSLAVSFTVGAVESHSSFSADPSATAASGATFSTQPVVSIADYTGAAVNDPVQLSISSQPSGPTATLTCTTNPVIPTSGGIASFAGCSITGPVGTYTLSATDTADGLVVATSSSITLTPGTASQLVFVQQPTNTAAGSAISPAVSVAVEDANGNVETGDNSTQISLAIGTNPGGGTLSGGSAVTVSSGIATFSGLAIDKTGTGYSLAASSTPSYTGATSSAFSVTVGAANHLAFIQQPSNTQAASAISPSVSVAVEDANGNVETGDSSTQISLAIGTNPGGGTLSGGSATTVSSGIATFSGLSIDKTGTGYTLTTSSSPSYTTATSSAFNVTPGTATHLAFIQQPSNAQAASAISPSVTVAVEDANGNVETGDNSTEISLAIGTNPGGGTLSGGSAVTVSAGVATFSGLSIDKTGTGYTLTASSSPSYTTATSSAFNVTPGTPTQLVFVQQPTNTAAGSAISPAVSVAVEDANGNVETGDNSTQISLAIGTNPGGGTLSGGSAVTVSSGIATFSGLAIDKTGTGYSLAASSTPSYTGATSSAFSVTVGAANHLAFIQQPSNTQAASAISPSVSVAVEDANGNVETGDSSTQISLAIGTNPGGGTLSGGSATTVSSGIATFSGLSIDKTGTGYTLTTSSSPSYTTATSSAFNVTPGTATHLAFIQQPSNAQAASAISPSVTVAVEDANGNVETGDNSTEIGLAIGTNPGGGTLSGGSAVTVSAGVATFSGLSIDKTGTGYTLTASSSPSYTTATSSAFNVTPGTPTQLVFVQQPTNTAAGSAISPAVSVAVEDANGNVETGDNSTQISLAIGTNPGGGTLSGGSAVRVSSGIATFSGLAIDKTGTGYSLAASSTPSYTGATSSAFSVAPGTPTQLVFVQQPTNTAAGSAISPAVSVAVEDANGNVETGDNSTQISLAIGTNPGGGTLSGGSAVRVSSGVAAFSNLSIDLVGVGYTVNAIELPSRWYRHLGRLHDIDRIGQSPRLHPAAFEHRKPPRRSHPRSAWRSKTPTATSRPVTTPPRSALAIGTNPGGGTLSGGSATTVSSGIATFSGLSIDKTGTGYTLTTSSSPSYTTATSSAFNVTPGTATHLAFIQQPSNAQAASAISPSVTVAVEDANGNVETGDNSTEISLAIGTNPGGGTLSGGSAVTVSAGVATFSGLSIDKTGTGYTLTASSSPSYTTATSSAFNVTPGTPTQLVFVQQPTDTAAGSAISPAVSVAVEDANGNVETGDNSTQISLAIGTNPGGGTLSGGSAVRVSSGIATFSGLAIDKTGTGYSLAASSTPSYTGGDVGGLQRRARHTDPARLRRTAHRYSRRYQH